MIKQVIECCVTPLNYIPSLEDIRDAIALAEKNNCIIKLSWYKKYDGWYKRFVEATDDANEVYAHLPHVYGL